MAEANDNDNNAANGGANGGGDGDDYVVLDGKGEEMTMTSTNASLSPEHDLKSLSYLMEIFTIFIVAGGSFTALIHHDDVLALKISMSFLLVQLAFAVNKKRPFGTEGCEDRKRFWCDLCRHWYVGHGILYQRLYEGW